MKDETLAKTIAGWGCFAILGFILVWYVFIGFLSVKVAEHFGQPWYVGVAVAVLIGLFVTSVTAGRK